MHRKDYELIARVVKEAQHHTPPDQRWAEFMRSRIAIQLCMAFQEQHPQFRADLFMNACGFEQLHNLPRR